MEERDQEPGQFATVVAALAIVVGAFLLLMLLAYLAGVVGHLGLRALELGWQAGA